MTSTSDREQMAAYRIQNENVPPTPAETAARAAGARVVAETALRATSDEGLLRAYASLTHRLHEAATTVRANPATWAKQTEADLRVQRDVIEAEVLRRMGETR